MIPPSVSTTEMDPRAILERHTEEVWNRGNLDAVDTYIAEDYVERDSAGTDEFHGPEGYKRSVENYRAAFPDLTVTIEESIVVGDRIVMRQRFTGTHEGTFMGIEPTGDEIESTSMLICRIENDRIAETWVETDTLGLLEDLGVEIP